MVDGTGNLGDFILLNKAFYENEKLSKVFGSGSNA
jgi:hypothetical protein